MTNISLDTSDNVPRQAFHEKVERVKELESENQRLYSEWKLAAASIDELMRAMEQAHDILRTALNEGNRLRVKNGELKAENEALRKVFDATWEALDGLYGADMGEVIPVTLLPEGRQRLFNRVLEVVGETGVMEMLEESE